MRESVEIERLYGASLRLVSVALIEKAELFPALSHSKILNTVTENIPFLEAFLGVRLTLPGIHRLAYEIKEVMKSHIFIS